MHSKGKEWLLIGRRRDQLGRERRWLDVDLVGQGRRGGAGRRLPAFSMGLPGLIYSACLE